MGETTNDIFDTLPSTGTDYSAAAESLTQRFDPSTNKDMEIYEFRQITQESGETINEFYRRLKENRVHANLLTLKRKYGHKSYTKHPIIAFAAKHYAKKWIY